MIFQDILAAGLSVAVAALVSGQTQSAAGDTLTIRQAVDLAVTAYPMLRAAESQIEAAEARVQRAHAERLPEVRISETLSYGNNPVFVFGSLLEQNRFGPNNFALSSLNDPAALHNFRGVWSSRIPLFDGHQTSARIEQATAGKRSAIENKASVEQRIRFETLRSYYGLVLTRAGRDVARQAIQTAEADAELARNRRDAGIAVDAELLAAQVQLADLRRRLIEAEGEAVLAEAQLNILMGRSSGDPVSLPPTYPFREFTAPSEEDLVRMAFANRPDYVASEFFVRSAHLVVQERNGDRLPHIEGFANVGLSGRSPVTGSPDYSIGASVSFNIFSAGHNARVAEARHLEAVAAAQIEETRRQIRLDVLRARQQWLTAGDQVRVARASVGQATEVLRITENRYEAGLETITPLLRAQTDLVKARMNLIASENAYAIGYASILLVTGTLTDVNTFSGSEVQQ